LVMVVVAVLAVLVFCLPSAGSASAALRQRLQIPALAQTSRKTLSVLSQLLNTAVVLRALGVAAATAPVEAAVASMVELVTFPPLLLGSTLTSSLRCQRSPSAQMGGKMLTLLSPLLEAVVAEGTVAVAGPALQAAVGAVLAVLAELVQVEVKALVVAAALAAALAVAAAVLVDLVDSLPQVGSKLVGPLRCQRNPLLAWRSKRPATLALEAGVRSPLLAVSSLPTALHHPSQVMLHSERMTTLRMFRSLPTRRQQQRRATRLIELSRLRRSSQTCSREM